MPWVVWYETGATGTGLQGPNGMVFAAKGVNDGGAADGGFHWVAVGNGGQGDLDTPRSTASARARVSIGAEQACSLNADPTADAEDPRVAAGTMNSANPTVPWVAWDELVGCSASGVREPSRRCRRGRPLRAGQRRSADLAGGCRRDATGHHVLGQHAVRDVAVTDAGGNTTTTVGHFVNAANPTFVVDKSGIPITPTGTGAGQADVREPISSGCTANPFNADGATCQGGALGTPFFLFTNGTSPRSLFADAYQPDAPVTGAATGVGQYDGDRDRAASTPRGRGRASRSSSGPPPPTGSPRRRSSPAPTTRLTRSAQR